MYLVLYIEHYLQPTSPCVLKILSSRCPTLFDETLGSNCHLPSDFSSKFQVSMTMFHQELVRREGRVLANG